MNGLTRGQRFLVYVYGALFVGMTIVTIVSFSDRDKARVERDQAVNAKGIVVEACRLKVEPPPAS